MTTTNAVDTAKIQDLIVPEWRRGAIYISFDEYKIITTADLTEVHSGGITENIKDASAVWRKCTKD